MSGSADEFDEIARLFAPASFGAPEALGLVDDAALIPARPGFDLIVTKDAIVAGVHLLEDSPPEAYAAKLVRSNLSDLAAKGAVPDGAFLAVAWPQTWEPAARTAFAARLFEDFQRFGLRLLGGDTVSTRGPFTASLTLLGYAPQGTMVRRSGAKAGDILMVTGPIGDGCLGLMAARGEGEFSQAQALRLAQHYQAPQPRLDLCEALRTHAHASADISDGLLADAGHVARASGLRVEIQLDAMPLSIEAQGWLLRQPAEADALLTLATGGDDYQLVLAVAPQAVAGFQAAIQQTGAVVTPVGRFHTGAGLGVTCRGQPISPTRLGYQHAVLTSER